MKTDQYFNRFLPLGGNVGCQQQVAFQLSQTPTSVDLRSFFGSVESGDGLMFKADLPLAVPTGGPARAYFSLTEKGTTLSENQLTGTASGAMAWPLLDGQEMLAHTSAGRIVATGFVTQMSFLTLNMKASVGSVWLRVMRHTLTEPQDASRFQAPIPNYPSMVGTGLAYPTGWNPRP